MEEENRIPKQIDAEKALAVKQKAVKIREEIGKVIVGNKDVTTDILVCLLCGGHALIEGVPGLGKTYMIKTMGDVLALSTSRIQFTPDLMPADILGTNVLVNNDNGEQIIEFQKGPVFAQVVIADEINRATPKTQSALLEVMQEQTVTIGGIRNILESPFIVLATQNPIEMEGTYPLPEAQLDRFFFKIKVVYPSSEEIMEIIDRTTGVNNYTPLKILGKEDIIEMQKLIREIPVSNAVKNYAVRMILATHPDHEDLEDFHKQYIRYGASPRGAQSLVLGARVYALLDGRFNVSFDDIRRAALPSLRHRIILSFEGEAEGISQEDIINKIINKLPETEG